MEIDITPGQKVSFDHAALGVLTGVAVKVFGNGKVQIECPAKLSGDREGIRKTTYNVPLADLRPAL